MHRREQIYFITNKTELLNIITDKICNGQQLFWKASITNPHKMEITLHSLYFDQNFIHCIKIQFSSEVSPCYCNLMRFFLSPIRFHQKYVEDAWISKVPLKLVEVKLETIQSKPVINIEVQSDFGLENDIFNIYFS